MFYEVTAPSGNISIVQADSSIKAKVSVCMEQGFKPSDRWTGTNSMTAKKLDIDFPDIVHRFDETSLAGLEGKNVLIFDSHHGTAVRIRAVSVEAIQYFLDEYSTIIVLQKG